MTAFQQPHTSSAWLLHASQALSALQTCPLFLGSKTVLSSAAVLLRSETSLDPHCCQDAMHCRISGADLICHVMLQWASGYTNPRMKWKLVADWQLLQVLTSFKPAKCSLMLSAFCSCFANSPQLSPECAYIKHFPSVPPALCPVCGTYQRRQCTCCVYYM